MIPCSHRHASDLADELAQDRVPEIAESVGKDHERAGPAAVSRTLPWTVRQARERTADVQGAAA
jgi:hypothetical protein